MCVCPDTCGLVQSCNDAGASGELLLSDVQLPGFIAGVVRILLITKPRQTCVSVSSQTWQVGHRCPLECARTMSVRRLVRTAWPLCMLTEPAGFMVVIRCSDMCDNRGLVWWCALDFRLLHLMRVSVFHHDLDSRLPEPIYVFMGRC